MCGTEIVLVLGETNLWLGIGNHRHGDCLEVVTVVAFDDA